MTAPARDIFHYKGELYYIEKTPLLPYLKAKGIKFPKISTANWRGYLAEWEVRDNKLYLIGMDNDSPYVDKDGNTRIALIRQYIFRSISRTSYVRDKFEALFPGQKEVFAEWFTGEIVFMYEEYLGGADSWGLPITIYSKSKYLSLLFKKGVLISERETKEIPTWDLHEEEKRIRNEERSAKSALAQEQ